MNARSESHAERTAEAACPYCGVGCRLDVRVKASGEIAVRGSATAAANRGRICPKGATVGQVLGAPDRARTPLVRESRSEPFHVVSWDDAVEFVTRRLGTLTEKHGPGVFGFYGSGQLDTEAVYAAVKLVKGGLGVNNTDSNSRLCMASAVAGYRASLGSDGPPCCYEDIASADVILILGSNMAEAHPVTYDFVRAKKRLNPSTLIVVVDPRRTRTAEIADLHLPLRPGTDVAFLNALAYFLVTRGLIDHRFVNDHTVGFDELADDLEGTEVTDLAEACGVEPGVLLQLADRIGTAQRFLSFYSMGANQSIAGVDKNVSLINLHLLTGQIGKPGAGPFSLTGQPNAMGGREAGLLAGSLPGYRSIDDPMDRREIEGAWGLRPGSISPRPGKTALEMFSALSEGQMKAIWIAATNPMVSLPDRNAARRGLERAELVIVQDCYAPTDTMEFAHVALPAAQWGEKEGTTTNSERTVTFSEKFVDPPGEALPDWEIFCRVARAMRLPGFEFGSAAEIWEEFRRLTRGRLCNLSGMTADRLRQERSMQWPCPDEQHPGTLRLYTEHRFSTPDGRARILSRRFRAPAELPDAAYPLRLLTGRVACHWHSRTRTRHVPLLEAKEPQPFVQIHPEDAGRRAIEDGTLVCVKSRRGSVILQARVSVETPPGTLFAPFHWGELFRQYASLNAVTTSAADPVSKQPELKHCAVEATPLSPLQQVSPER